MPMHDNHHLHHGLNRIDLGNSQVLMDTLRWHRMVLVLVLDGLGWDWMLIIMKTMMMIVFTSLPPHPTQSPGLPYKTLIEKAVHASDDQTRQIHLHCKGALLKYSLVQDKFAPKHQNLTQCAGTPAY